MTESSCIGETVPVPDWDLYIGDPHAVPTSCADGGPGTSLQSTRLPTVTVIAPDQSLPSSLRAELAYRTNLPRNLNGNFRYTFSRGFGLWGYADLNLDPERVTTIGEEERPFYGDPMSIVQRTGAVSFAGSRLHSEFGNVYEVKSDRQSRSHQFSVQANGRVFPKLQVNTNYTLGFTRDQGSGSFAAVPVVGNPNEVAWGTANNDRRHTSNFTLTYTLSPEVELSATTRLSSGQPFTPLVNRDVNGDGARNDRAFVFDPNATADTALANGMLRLLHNVPGRVRDCLRAQYDTFAARNSCREAWTQSIDFRANVRPNLPHVQRRLTLSLDTRNVLTAVDQLLHETQGVRRLALSERAARSELTVEADQRRTVAWPQQVVLLRLLREVPEHLRLTVVDAATDCPGECIHLET
jgi:hypothetical protein